MTIGRLDITWGDWPALGAPGPLIVSTKAMGPIRGVITCGPVHRFRVYRWRLGPLCVSWRSAP